MNTQLGPNDRILYTFAITICTQPEHTNLGGLELTRRDIGMPLTVFSELLVALDEMKWVQAVLPTDDEKNRALSDPSFRLELLSRPFARGENFPEDPTTVTPEVFADCLLTYAKRIATSRS